MGITLALMSMLFAGVNDFVFKQYTTRPGQALGWLLSGIGLVVTLVFGALLFHTAGAVTGAHWPVSLGAGLASLLANILFVRSLRTMPAGTGATIYRLNLVVVAVLGFLWLHEPVTPWKVAGITLGAAAVFSLGASGAGAPTAGRATTLGLGLLIAACLLRALMGILYKIAGTDGVPMYEVLAVTGAVWFAGGMLYALANREWQPATPRLAGYAALCGLLVCGITYFMLGALRFADASVAIPITQMSFIVTCVLGATLHREPFTSPKLLAIAAALGCVVCLSVR